MKQSDHARLIGGNAATRPPKQTFEMSWTNPALRAFFYQALLFFFVIFVAVFLYWNMAQNLSRQNIATGFGFLQQPARFNIGESIIAFSATDTFGRAILVGLLNTLRVSAVVIVAAALLGIVVGLAKASTNPVFSTIGSAYVELVRNIPAVLHVVVWAAIVRNLPAPRSALELWGFGFISNRGLALPSLNDDPTHIWVVVAGSIGLIAAVFTYRFARNHADKTGSVMDPIVPSILVFIAVPLATSLALGSTWEFSVPVRQGFAFSGGWSLTAEFAGLAAGLTIYSAAFVAEIVRAGIQSVAKGQAEAAASLSLTPFQSVRYIVFPQAMKVIIPPLTGQMLSITKNSSLGVIIGYPDLVSVGNTSMNITGQAVEMIAIMMVIYFSISIAISILMNIYNSRKLTKER